MVDVCLLGCGGMMPLPDRRLTALLYRYNGKMILVDCGEGTQLAVKLAGWGFKAIDAICFTHYHADHIAGLPGLLSTIGNSGRTEALTLIGPPALIEVVRGLCVIVPALPFELRGAVLPDGHPSGIRVGDVHIGAFPAEHSIPCLSYSLEIKRAGRFDAGRAERAGIPRIFWRRLQNGETVEAGGGRYTPDMVLGAERKGIKVSYITDTRPREGMAGFAKDSDLLVCEGMYGGEDKRADAVKKGHMTFAEAAALARDSGAKELWLTHYSPSLKDPEEFIEGARSVFENTVAGRDLLTKTLKYAE